MSLSKCVLNRVLNHVEQSQRQPGYKPMRIKAQIVFEKRDFPGKKKLSHDLFRKNKMHHKLNMLQ